MADDDRTHFALTQQQMAAWLRVARSTVAGAERGNHFLPAGAGIRSARLSLGAVGRVLDADGQPQPAGPPVPTPPPLPEPLQKRLRDCRYHLGRLRRELTKLQEKAIAYTNRLAALPALRGWTGPDPDPAQAAAWLGRFEEEAISELLYTCGAGPQALLSARIAGLEREAELLEAALV